MFSRIFIEHELKDHERVTAITKRFKNVPITYLDNVDDVFGRVKKPYLQKRQSLQLFLGNKKGTLTKAAPDAYGVAGDPHYYFIHAYNCIYECEYCYLQGYFNSPDIVLYLNHNDICRDIERLVKEHADEQTIWFHAGEFSDSLALSHLSGELPQYFELFEKLTSAKLELRTKSANVAELLKLSPLSNVITSFSLSPQKRIEKTDLKTPSLKHRLIAMKKLYDHGHPLALHLDPIIHEDQFEKTYQELFKSIFEILPPHAFSYISIGVVRFTADVFRQVGDNYPDSDLLAAEFITSFDKKVRYPKPFRLWLLNKIKDIALSHGVEKKQIYLCME
jgi:spore photoproduct lyase